MYSTGIDCTRFCKPFILANDASDKGTDTVMPGTRWKETPSQKLTDTRDTIDPSRENVWRLFGPLIKVSHLSIQMDHQALLWLQSMKKTNQLLQWWSWKIQDYQATFQHISSTENVIEDGLSRRGLMDSTIRKEAHSKVKHCELLLHLIFIIHAIISSNPRLDVSHIKSGAIRIKQG